MTYWKNVDDNIKKLDKGKDKGEFTPKPIISNRGEADSKIKQPRFALPQPPPRK